MEYLSFPQFSVGGHTRRYIVAQGPMEHTCTHFWQMVWEQNVSILLMLTSEMVHRLGHSVYMYVY